MGEQGVGLDLNAPAPVVVMMAGLQGSGKTTTTGKLAKLLKERQGKKVLVVSCDVYRPAAIDQLETVAAQVGVSFFPSADRRRTRWTSPGARWTRQSAASTTCSSSTPPGGCTSTTR